MTIKRAIVTIAAIMLAGMSGASTAPAVAAPKPPAPITYSSYMAPGSTAETETQTRISGVNHDGVKGGYFVDTAGQTHGFTDDGTFRQIDVPDATSTYVTSINDGGTIVGYFTDSSNVEHGFLGTATGSGMTTFDDPALPTDSTVLSGLEGHGTVATGINTSGVVVGYSYTIGPDTYEFMSPEGLPETGPVTHYHGFIRSSDGTSFSAYDAPGAMQAGVPHVGTRLLGINSAGSMVGAYTYERPVQGQREPTDAGFVISGKKFTRIVYQNPDIPTNSCAWHEPHGINDAGVIVGDSGNACGGFQEAWLLSKGKFTRLAYYRSETDFGQWTWASGINNDGVVAGAWGTGNGGVRGFTATTR